MRYRVSSGNSNGQAFALLCLHAEGRVIERFVSTFLSILGAMAETETRGGREQSDAWDKISSIVNKI